MLNFDKVRFDVWSDNFPDADVAINRIGNFCVVVDGKSLARSVEALDQFYIIRHLLLFYSKAIYSLLYK
jgi:hypothetical protein